MASSSALPPILRADPDGRTVVGVPITPASGEAAQYVWLDRAIYDGIVSRYGEPSWFLHGDGKGSPFVRVRLPGVSARPEMASRLVWLMATGLQAPPRRRISYNDGDRLNLRRRNLIVSSGRGKKTLSARLNYAATVRRQAAGKPAYGG